MQILVTLLLLIVCLSIVCCQCISMASSLSSIGNWFKGLFNKKREN